MSTLATENKTARKVLFSYLAACLFCIFVNWIYAKFAHGVASASMTYMFLYPLIGGSIRLLFSKYLSAFASTLYGCGIFTLTLGSFTNGVLVIAGTTSSYIPVFYVCGIGLLLCSVLLFLIRIFHRT